VNGYTHGFDLKEKISCTILSLAAVVTIGSNVLADERLVLDSYTCADFLSDTGKTTNGPRLLRSLMMVSWATGYVAAHQKDNTRADDQAIQLVAETLGDACRRNPTRTAVQAVVDTVKQFTNADTSAEPHLRDPEPASTPNPAAISAPSPTVALRGFFNTYDNFDMKGGELRTLKKIELDKCSAACQSEKSCHAFSFDKWNKWCFLKSTVSSLILEPSTITGVRKNAGGPATSDVAVRMERRPAKSFEGSGLRNVSVGSPESCQQACEHDAKCLGFTFSRADQACKLFENIGTFSPNGNSTSGFKTQYPP
jgi:hypothetical protein